MFSKIRILDEHTINKIAAGEVIENSASVVKELIENSLDANATEISIEIKAGGRQLVKIVDNGMGMCRDDAIICLERHATSKIKNIDDINKLVTKGFRGEAISSIASISKFTLITCENASGNGKKSSEGTTVIVDGGKIIYTGPSARAPGTTVEVKSLFFNVPARLKFQKTISSDMNAIHKVVIIQALSNPYVCFKFINNQKTCLSTFTWKELSFLEALKKRINDVLGPEILSTMVSINREYTDIMLTGFIGMPNSTRHNRSGQYLFVNQRHVIMPQISTWISEGFGTRLSAHCFPVFVLHLTIPGDIIDVNVHPQKREIRISNISYLREIIVEAVDSALSHGQRVFSQTQKDHAGNIEDHSYNMETYPEENHSDDIKDHLYDVNDRTDSIEVKCTSPSFDYKSAYDNKEIEGSEEIEKSDTKILDKDQFSDYITINIKPMVIGTIRSYILVDGRTLPASCKDKKDGFVVIDQHLAHSRIIFDKMVNIDKDDSMVESQNLLVPVTLEVTSIESNILMQNMEYINKLGISLRSLGGNTFIVDAMPAVVKAADVTTLIWYILEELQLPHGKKILEREKEREIALAASRMAISAKERLMIDQAQAIVDGLFKSKDPYNSPSGKPTMFYLSHDDIAQKFKH